MENLKFSLTREVLPPIREHSSDAGFDVFLPALSDSYINDVVEKNPSLVGQVVSVFSDAVVVAPETRVLLPLGIKLNIPEGYVVLGFDKSGVAHKKGLHLISGVIDAGYQGEIMVNLFNTSKSGVKIEAGSKVAQLLVLPVFTPFLQRVEEKDLYSASSSRGDGGYGSTGV